MRFFRESVRERMKNTVKVDTKDRIARSNIYSIFGALLKKLIKNNEQGEIILKKAGLSSLVNEYKDKLCPYRYNGKYQNTNDQYNPEAICIKICEDLESDEEILLQFLNVILEDIHEISNEQYERLLNYLNIIGYELLENDDNYDRKNFKLIPSSDGIQQRNTDVSYLHS